MSKLLTAILTLLTAFLFNVTIADAQFKDKGPKGDQLRYNGWLQKQYRHNGSKLNRGQRNALGLPNGFLGTGLFANRSKSKSKKSTTSKK